VILEEDMKWTIPSNIDKEEMIKSLEAFGEKIQNMKKRDDYSFDDWNKEADAAIQKGMSRSKTKKEEFDVDAAAKDVIAGKYKNAAERKKALGDDYEVVQKRVNEMLKHSDDDQNELYHHGILGQKWGVRRFENKNGHLTAAGKARYDDGKVSAKEKNAFSAKAAGHKLMAKVYGANEKAYAKSNKTLASMNAHAKNEQLKKAEAAQKEANAKRAARIEKNERYRENYKNISDKTTLGEKLMYNDATFRKAAKIMTKNQNVTVSEAMKQAKGEAWRNTAIMVGAYGALTLGAMYASNKS
jgi:hypothetical protein